MLKHKLAPFGAAIIAVASPASAQPSRQIDYALAGQPLSAALRAVSLQSGVSVLAPSELVQGRQAPPLNGRFTARAAIEILIEGTGLEISEVGDALVLIRTDPARDSNSQPKGTSASAIVVTGTHLRSAQPTSPVIVISRKDIDASGSNSVEQLLRRLPHNAQDGVNRENFRTPGAGADPTEHGSGVNLRGLGQRATLVLVNGRRVAPSNSGSFVDISLIPVSAIDRVEIVTDGASAIYGSDAVGGVVNFILRDDFSGLETGLTAGSATEGDGDVLQAAVTGGTHWRTGDALLSYEYRAEDSIVARDRAFTINLAPDTSLLPEERRHSLFGVLDQQLSSRLGAELSANFATRDTTRSYFLSGSAIPVDTSASAKSWGGSLAFHYDLGRGWAAQLSGGYSRTDTDQHQQQTGGSGLVNDRTTRNAIADIGLKLDGSLLEMPGGPLIVAVGLEGRREWFRDLFRTRTINQPRVKARNVGAAFIEAQVPIFSGINRRPGLERLTASLAARYEHYDGFGSTFDPKLGLLWSPLRGLSFKGSYSTSFRAPLLSESAGAFSAIFVPEALVFVNASQAQQRPALVLGGSNPDVSPERSRAWTLGAELAPPRIPGLSMSVNYYAIRFRNRITLPSPIITVVGDPAFESIVTRGADRALVQSLIDNAAVLLDISGPGFSNGHATAGDVSLIVDGRINNTAASTTDGVDLNLRYAFALGSSQFLVEANANRIFSFRDRLRPTSPTINALDIPFRPLSLKARGHAGWTRGGWAANLFVNHANDYRDNRGGRSLRVASFTTVDAGLAYEFDAKAPKVLRGARIALNAQNLLDNAPPRLLPDPGTTAGIGYDPVNASGRGRFVSLQLRKSW